MVEPSLVILEDSGNKKPAMSLNDDAGQKFDVAHRVLTPSPDQTPPLRRVPGAHLEDGIVPVFGMPFRLNGDGDRVLVKVAPFGVVNGQSGSPEAAEVLDGLVGRPVFF